MYLVAVYFEIFVYECFSLKEKRMHVRRVKDKVFSKFKVRITEVKHLDNWQKAGLAFSLISNESRKLERESDKIMNFIVQICHGEVLNVEKYYESYR